MGNMTLETPCNDSVLTSRKERIVELRQEQQKAELADAIEEASGVLNVVESAGDSFGLRLGPTLFAPVLVNGVTTKALVDTGSPVSLLGSCCEY
jgi:hypothetical protein